jgi:class 3 adenylate cyclase
MASNLTDQVRGIVKVVTAVADGNLRQKLTVQAKGEVAALGDTINLAHRLLENAKPGQILVSEACCGYIYKVLGKYPDDVVFGGQEPIKVKGRQQVTTVYEVLSR